MNQQVGGGGEEEKWAGKKVKQNTFGQEKCVREKDEKNS